MKKLNVLLMPVGSLGDVNPFIGLGLTLRERGHQVTVLANEFLESYIGQAGLDFVKVGEAEHFKQLFENPDIWALEAAGFFRLFFSMLHMPLIRSQYEAIVERYIPGRTVVVASGLAFGARIARDVPGVPLVTVHLQPLSFRSIYKPPPGLKVPWWVPGFAIKAIHNYLDRILYDPVFAPNINSFRWELGLEPIKQILLWWHSPDCVLAFFPPFFAEPQPGWPPQTRLVGFPIFDAERTHPLPKELSEFIEASEVTVVFMAGSLMAHARQFFRESVSVCEALGFRGILLTQYPEQIPDVLPETVRYFGKYVPFSQLFPLVDAVVHHGGMGTIALCLRAGVRQLIVPFSFDQPDNALRVESLGVGLSIKATDYHGEKLIQKMNELLKSERFKTAALQWKHTLQETDAFTIACQEIETVVQ